MLICIEGLANSGKTVLQTRMLRKEWLAGWPVWANYPLFFPPDNDDVNRWDHLSQIYEVENAVIGIDEAQRIMDAHNWHLLPPFFKDKIATHRHDKILFIVTTQDFKHIDFRLRSNVHELYTVEEVYRYPKDQRLEPVVQISRYMKKKRDLSLSSDHVKFVPAWKHNRFLFISKYWTKKYYDTYTRMRSERYIFKVEKNGKKWQAKLYNRTMVESGKARM